MNRLTGITYPDSTSVSFGYDSRGRRISATDQNNRTTTYAYDDADRLISVTDAANHQTTYAYDTENNLTSNNVTEGYTYDSIYELTQVVQGATTTESYGYDAVGNRLSSLGMNPYTYNASNQLTSTPSGSYAYDANGNTLTDAQGRSFTWDFENRLIQVVNPGVGTTTFRYDPFGRRIQKSGPLGTTNYLYDGPNLLEELDQSGNVLTRYTDTFNLDESLSEIRSGTTSYYEADGIGSTTSLSNSAAALANTYTYDSFGKLAASTGTLANPFQFTGREFDQETGIYQYRARYYDQNLGRLLSEDPAGFDGGRTFYSYVRNNPELLIDVPRQRKWDSLRPEVKLHI